MEEQNCGDIQASSVSLIIQDHPLAQPATHKVFAGFSINELCQKIPNNGGSDPFVTVNNQEVSHDYIVKDNDVVNVTLVPAGGLEWYWVVAIVLGSAAISYALMPDIGGDIADTPDDVFSRITGIRNKFPIYEPFQAVLGKRKIAPVYIARPFTTIEGGREYFHGLFSAGYGPLKLENFTIGGTNLADFDDVEIVVLDHFENTDENVIREFWKSDIAQENIQIALNEEDGYVNRSAEVQADTLISNFLYPSGVFSYDSKGNIKGADVHIRQDFQAENLDWYTPILYRDTLGTLLTIKGTVTIVNGEMRLWTSDSVSVNTTNASQVNNNSILFTYDYIDTRPESFTGDYNDNYILAKNVPESLFVTSHRHANSKSKPIFTALRLKIRSDLWPSGGAIPTRVKKIAPTALEEENMSGSTAVTWESLQTIRPLTQEGFREGIGYNRPDLYVDGVAIRTFRPTVIGIRMRATGQLNGNLDDFMVDATMVVPQNKTSDWRNWSNLTLEASTNPADAYKWLMQGPMNYSPIDINKIDHESIGNWRARCISEGWKISELVDYSSTLFAELQKIGYLARAEFSFNDGKFGVVERIEQVIPRQIFTPKNSANFQSKRVYPEVVDGVKFTFNSAQIDYEEDEGVFLDPFKNPATNGGDSSKLKGRYVTNKLWGVDNYDQAYRLSRFDYYEQFLQRELYTLDVDIEGLASNRGDLVRVSSDIISVGYGHGRITAISGDIITIDETINTDNISVQMGVQIRNQEGVILTTNADYLGDGRWDVGNLNPSVNIGDLVVYGEAGKEAIDCIIRSITYNKNLGASLVLVNSANEVYNYDGDPIPVYNPSISISQDSTRPLPPIISANTTNGVVSVLVSNPARTTDTSYRTYIQVRDYPVGLIATDFFQSPEEGWSFVEQADFTQTAFDLLDLKRGFNYQIRAVFKSDLNIFSGFSNIVDVELPLSVLLPPINNLSSINAKDGTYLIYSPVDDLEFASYEIRTDTNFGVDDSDFVGTTKDNNFFVGLLTNINTYYVAVKNIYGEYGVPSQTTTVLNVPNDPISFTAENEGFGTRLSWQNTDVGYQIDKYVIRFTEANVGNDFALSQELGSVNGLTLSHSTSDIGTYWYYVKAVDIAGNESGWVSTSVLVELSSSYITDQVNAVETNIERIDTQLGDLDFDIVSLATRSEDMELEILQSLAQQSASREELRNRITEGEVLIDAAVYIDPSNGTIINRAFLYSDELFNQAQLEIDGVNATITATVDSISLLEGEVQDLSSQLELVPGQITATATSVVAEAIQALEPVASFNFFDSAQGWVAVTGTLTTPLPNQINITHGDIENTSFDFDAVENPSIRITIERTGGTGWNGDIIVTYDNATTQTMSGIIEDVQSGGEIVRNIDLRGISQWDGQVNEIRLVLGDSVADTFIVKSIVIGKPDAALVELEDVTARVTQAEIDINAVDGRVTTTVDQLNTFQDDTDDNFITVNETIDAVEGKIENRVFEIVGNRREFEEDALQQLLNEIDNANYRIEDLDKSLSFADAINLLQVDVSSEGALAKSISALEAVTVNNGTAIQANTTLLQQVSTDVNGNAEAITSILSGVTGEIGEADALLQLESYLSEGGLGARAFLGTDVNGKVTGIVVNDDGITRQIELVSDSTVFVDSDGNNRIFYDLVNQRYVFDGEIQAQAGSFSGNVESTTGNIGGWDIRSGLLRSSTSGRRVELNATLNRVSVFDAVNEKVAMGYLEGLPKNDGSGNWSSADYGFWARSGDQLSIDGAVEYVNGNFVVQNDASVKVLDSQSREIVRLGTDNGNKGMFVYNTTGDRIVELSSGGMLIGDISGQYIRWTAGGGLDISGDIDASGGTIGGWRISNTSLSNGNDVVLSTTQLTLGDSFSWSASTGLTVDSDANIAGWIVEPNLFKSSNTGARVELNATLNRVSVFDAVNEKVAMGYLSNLPKYDQSGNWSSNDYGFWARRGDRLTIDGDVEYNNGDFLIENDASLRIRDGVNSNELLRVGTDTGEKGLFIYDGLQANGDTSNQVAKFTNDELYIGDSTDYISWNSVDGLEVSGKITVGTQIGGETVSDLQNRTTTAQSTANTAQSNATTALNTLSDIANDDRLTPSEKQATKLEMDKINEEYPIIISQATEFSVSSADYINKHTAINNYTSSLLSDLTTTSVIVGTTFRSNFVLYYDSRQQLLNAISNKAKLLADNAQTTANTAQSNLTTLTNNLGDLAYDDLVERAKLGTTIIDGAFIDTDLINVGVILGVDAVFSGSLSAATGTFSGTLSAVNGTFNGLQTTPSGVFSTGGSGISGTRVLINGPTSSTTNSIWIGNGVENDTNRVFSIKKTGEVYAKDILVDGGTIQSIGTDAMIVRSANPFGPNNLIEWYGPTSGNLSSGQPILNNLTKQNGVFWLDSTGEKSRDVERKAVSIPFSYSGAKNTWITLGTLSHQAIGGVAEIEYLSEIVTGNMIGGSGNGTGVARLRVIDNNNQQLVIVNNSVIITQQGSDPEAIITLASDQAPFKISVLDNNTSETKYIDKNYRLQFQLSTSVSYTNFGINVGTSSLFKSLEVAS